MREGIGSRHRAVSSKQVDWPTLGDDIGAYVHLDRWRARVSADAIAIESSAFGLLSVD
ncbi:hypothetical protein L842_1776 [Mycobacterium intracellulare MIN_052511_1280]|nr:hypothetical protein L842_1776 [Mycobacterium intracellulare MIN_052511_1280]